MTFGTPFHTEKSQLASENSARTGSMAAEEGMLSGGLGAKLKCPTPISRLRVEKIEGGLMVAGVVIAANCQIALPAFGTLFMLVGAVLTAASYRGPGEDEDKNSYAARIAFTGNSRILGPICIVVGALMLALGVLLCMLTRRARRRERRVGFHCPLHGDFYPLSPVQGIKMLGESISTLYILEFTSEFNLLKNNNENNFSHCLLHRYRKYIDALLKTKRNEMNIFIEDLDIKTSMFINIKICEKRC
ncbi:Uncharacterized protein DBV15_06418 [Temnothorax longispinosus]|uniref:Transmembrane protein n=1 Tax=Temnothorax longispinosus TaxID=300112 RepID=A0A4S2KT81_9HYME|nr:Uncharacterized protein DBV15_06418 [Temnothorax longispinosus]